MHGSEVRNAIRRDIGLRIAHLINQLFLDRGNNDPATGAFVFRYDKSAVGRCLDDWKTNIGEIGNAAPFILTITTRALRAAFNDMTGNSPGSQTVPIIRGQTE